MSETAAVHVGGVPSEYQPHPPMMAVPVVSSGGGPRGPASHSMDQSQLVNDQGCCSLLCPSSTACLCSTVLPCVALFCFCPQIVGVRSEAVMLSFGKYVGTIRNPGCYCINQLGTKVRTVSTTVRSVDISNLNVADLRGNPLRVSGVVSYRVSNSHLALLDIDNYAQYLRTQAEVVMKQICSHYPYEASTKAAHHEDSLKREADKVRGEIVALLQSKVSCAGISILQYEFNEIAYAPEIAAQMLVRQQAEAMLDARKVVIEGAVNIAHDAVTAFGERGIHLDQKEAGRLASNLVITICSETRVTPTMNIS